MYANVADSSTGTVIAGHRIVGTLARSSSGAAFRAVDQNDTPVILRLFNAPGGRAAVERFEERAKLLSSLSHPATARVTAFGEASEGLWLATVEVEGVTLRRLIDGEIEPMRAVRLLGEIADGLDAAHAAGVPHGDVRAGNVIVQGRHIEQSARSWWVFRSTPAWPTRRGTFRNSLPCCVSAYRRSTIPTSPSTPPPAS